MKFTTFPENVNPFLKKGIVKFGIDPTAPNLHLGHLMPIKLVKNFIQEGFEAHIILGTFTATLGDPSGKDAMRPILTPQQTNDNAQIIIQQIRRILGDNIHIHMNSEWFDKMTLPEMMGILSKYTVHRLLTRDSFQKRIENNAPIGAHELMVPLLQGYDSVVLKSAVEVGGSDQLFNFVMSRELQELMGQEPQTCVMSGIINGTDGRKMSKSYNNCIFINDTPTDVFGKVMSISDTVMFEWLPLFFDEVDTNRHPMELKKKLATKVTDEIWGEGSGINERQGFENRFSKGIIPDDIMEVPNDNIVVFITKVNNCSKSDARRLLAANSVSVNDTKVSDVNHVLNANDIVRIGKRGIARVI